MSDQKITFTVFTKPWKLSIPELAAHIASLGFDGIELPVRPGYPVSPDNVTTDLLPAVRVLGEHGLTIASIAGPTTETAMAACSEAGIPIIRICADVEAGESYLDAESRIQRYFDTLVPLLDKHGVTLGIQNHCGRGIANAMGLRSLISKYDPRHVAIVWDAAHNAINGEEPELALDIVWSHLCMVNFKNAFWERSNGPESESARWRPYWTTGRHGLASWPRVAQELLRRGYSGVVCLTAEYNDSNSVNRLAAEDISFARSLFASPE